MSDLIKSKGKFQIVGNEASEVAKFPPSHTHKGGVVGGKTASKRKKKGKDFLF